MAFCHQGDFVGVPDMGDNLAAKALKRFKDKIRLYQPKQRNDEIPTAKLNEYTTG